MGAFPPLTGDEKTRIADLHAKGWSCNRIATELGRSPATISRYAAREGLTWDREKTKAAVEAHKTDAKARRAELANLLLEDARRLRDQIYEPAIVYNFGGRENTYAENTLPEPDYAAKLKIMQAAGIAIDRSLRLDSYDSDEQGLSAVDAWLRSITGE